MSGSLGDLGRPRPAITSQIDLREHALREADPQSLGNLHYAHPLRGECADSVFDPRICPWSNQPRPLRSGAGEALEILRPSLDSRRERDDQ